MGDAVTLTGGHRLLVYPYFKFSRVVIFAIDVEKFFNLEKNKLKLFRKLEKILFRKIEKIETNPKRTTE